MFPARLPISRREWLAVGVFALVAVTLASWPWLVSFSSRPVDSTYLGTNVPDVLDTQVYYAFIQANANGQTLYSNLFTSDDQPAALFNPLWWGLGRLTAWTSWQPVTVFWLTKAIMGAGLIIGLYLVISIFFASARWRLLALLLAIFGSGLGGIFLFVLRAYPGIIWAYQSPAFIDALPTDLIYSAGFVWMSILHSPLYVASIGLLLWVGWATWRSLNDRRWIYAAGVGLLLLGLTHPYDLLLFFGVGATACMIGILGGLTDPVGLKKIIRQLLILGCWAIPAVLYYAFLVFAVPALGGWNEQNVLKTTNFRNVIAGMVPSIFFVVFGVKFLWHSDRLKLWLPLAWLTAALSLMYIPFNQYQAKMIIGLSIPVAILSTAGIRSWFQARQRKRLWMRLIIFCAVLLAMVTPGVFVVRTVESQRTESRYYFVSNDLLRALQWIRTSTPLESVILGDIWTGNLIPQYASRATYLGHHHQTSEFQKKLTIVRDWFFKDTNDYKAKADWLRDQGINFVIIGPNERRQGSFNPGLVPELVPIFSTDTVSVFFVQPNVNDWEDIK